MREYNYLIVDDDDMDRLATSFYLKKYPFLKHKASFSSSRDALNYLENKSVDVLFLDVDMPEISGIEFLKMVDDKVLCTVFITSHPEYAIDGFDLNAFDYIVKPLDKERFDSCITRLQEYLEIKLKAELFEHSFKGDSILVKEGYKYVAIQPYEVAYLAALKDYTSLVLLNQKKAIVHGNLKTMLNNDNFKDFIRIHKSYAVQKKYIKSIKGNELILVNDTVLPIGQIFKRQLLEILS